MSDFSWLTLRFEAPLLSFGGVAIDQIGITRDFPAASMITGLLASALGYVRQDWKSHQALQDRLVFAARCDRIDPGGSLADIQNAQLSRDDRGWTTWGEPEGRGGASLHAPHRRWREYHADASFIVCLRLAPDSGQPDLEDVRAAVDRPVRPLFVGRKPCLPSAPMHVNLAVSASSAYDALKQVPPCNPGQGALNALWPVGDGPVYGESVKRIIDLADLRNWRTGLHGGTRKVVEGVVEPLEESR